MVNTWVNIENSNLNRLITPAHQVTPELNKYQFKLTISNKQTGIVHSSKTHLTVVNSELPLVWLLLIIRWLFFMWPILLWAWTLIQM